MSVPNTFASATSSIPLANLDANFAYYDAAFAISGSAVTFAGSITLTTGTANGVPYLNASKVLTSGAVLTFDGTTLSSTKFAGALNGTVGATTANTGAFTTLTTSSTVTHNGGTANGVGYLNGSKVLTTGSALTFDGTSLSVNGGRVNASTADVGGTIGGTAQFVTVNTNGAVGDFSGIRFNYFNSGDSGGKFAYIGAVLTSNATNGLADIVFGVKSSTATTTISEQMRLTSTGLAVTGTLSATSSSVQEIATFAHPSTSTSANNGGAVIRIQNTSSTNGNMQSVLFANSSGTVTSGIFGYNANQSTNEGFLTFGTRNSAGTFGERMRLDSSGNLGIGTTTPALYGFLGVAKAITIDSVSVSAGFSDAVTGTLRITHASGSVGINFDSTNLIFQSGGTTPTTRMTLNSSGNLGLGVTPSAWDSVYRAFQVGAQGAFWANATAADIYMSANYLYDGANKYIANGYASFYSQNSGAHIWKTAPNNTSGAGAAATFTQAMTLDASGALLIGVTASSTTVFQEIKYTTAFLGTRYINTSSSASTVMDFVAASAQVGSITTSGSATLYNVTSDYRLKTVTGAVSGQGARIDALQPIEYTWNVSGERTRGFLAHQFQEVYAGSVSGTKDAVDADGKPMYQAMQASTSEVIADLVAELQSLRARVAQLESKP